MENLIALVVIGVLGYLGWHVIIAFFKGAKRAVEEIHDSGPSFFSKVMQSVVAGGIAGIILAVIFGSGSGIAGPLAIGVALVSFFVT